jgi:hypothetical protein
LGLKRIYVWCIGIAKLFQDNTFLISKWPQIFSHGFGRLTVNWHTYFKPIH